MSEILVKHANGQWSLQKGKETKGEDPAQLSLEDEAIGHFSSNVHPGWQNTEHPRYREYSDAREEHKANYAKYREGANIPAKFKVHPDKAP